MVDRSTFGTVLLVALVAGLATSACQRRRTNGEVCLRDNDCASDFCASGVCQEPRVYGATTSYTTTSSTTGGGSGGTPTTGGHGGAGGTGGAGGAAGGGTGGN